MGRDVPRLQDLDGAGGQVFVGAGWHIDPRWMVGANAELGVYDGESLPGTDQVVGVAS